MLRRLNVKGIGEWSSYNPENRIMHLNHFLLSCSLSHIHIGMLIHMCSSVPAGRWTQVSYSGHISPPLTVFLIGLKFIVQPD